MGQKASYDNCLLLTILVDCTMYNQSEMLKHISQVQWAWVLLHMACSLAVTIQLLSVLHSFIKPETTNSETEEINLENMEFPLQFKICVDPSFNGSAVEDLGYDGIWNYFAGLSRFNESIYGWAGHTNSSGVKDTVAGVLSKVTNPITAKELLTKFRIGWGPGDWSNLSSDQLYLARPNYPHNCYTLDISNQTRGKLIQTLYFYFKSPKRETVQVLVEGKGIETSRDVYDNMLLASGDVIDTQPGSLTKYVLKINQQMFVEEDTSKKCRNYPNEDFDSYAACDDHYMRSLCDVAGLLPIWLTDDINEVTVQASVNSTGIKGF